MRTERASDLTPKPPLSIDERARCQVLIASEHRGDEDEATTVGRLIIKTSLDVLRLRGVSTKDGVSLTDLAERRLRLLGRYQREMED